MWPEDISFSSVNLVARGQLELLNQSQQIKFDLKKVWFGIWRANKSNSTWKRFGLESVVIWNRLDLDLKVTGTTWKEEHTWMEEHSMNPKGIDEASWLKSAAARWRRYRQLNESEWLQLEQWRSGWSTARTDNVIFLLQVYNVNCNGLNINPMKRN